MARHLSELCVSTISKPRLTSSANVRNSLFWAGRTRDDRKQASSGIECPLPDEREHPIQHLGDIDPFEPVAVPGEEVSDKYVEVGRPFGEASEMKFVLDVPVSGARAEGTPLQLGCLACQKIPSLQDGKSDGALPGAEAC